MGLGIALVIFLNLIIYIIFFDVILSWLMVFGFKYRPKFIADIIDPLYKKVKKFIPTSIGPIDFTPIVIILLIYFIRGILFILFPELKIEATNLNLI